MQAKQHDVEQRQQPTGHVDGALRIGHVRLDALDETDPRHRLHQPLVDRTRKPPLECRPVIGDRQPGQALLAGGLQHFQMGVDTALAHQGV